MSLILLFAFVGVVAHMEVVARAFEEARARCAWSVKEAAGHYGVDRSQLARELQGIGHLSLTRIAAMPTVFVQNFALVLVKLIGLPDDVQVAVKISERVK